MAALALEQDTEINPIDLVEILAGERDWMVDRSCEDEVNLIVSGSWCDLHLSFNWHAGMEGLHIASTFDLKVPKNRRDEVTRVLALINEQLFYGHFDLWTQEGDLLFRHATMAHRWCKFNCGPVRRHDGNGFKCLRKILSSVSIRHLGR